MTAGKILLARPNPFIVASMTRLVQDAHLEAFPLQRLETLHHIAPEEVGGVVISTAVNSVIAQDYVEVFSKAMAHLPGKQVFLATMMDAESLKRSFSYQIHMQHGLRFQLLTLEEAATRDRLDPSNEIVIIRKDDLRAEAAFQKSKTAFLKVLNGHRLTHTG